MLTLNKKLMILSELLHNPENYSYQGWEYRLYDTIKDNIIDINKFIQYLSKKGYVVGDFHSLRITSDGKQYYEKLIQDLKWK